MPGHYHYCVCGCANRRSSRRTCVSVLQSTSLRYTSIMNDVATSIKREKVPVVGFLFISKISLSHEHMSEDG